MFQRISKFLLLIAFTSIATSMNAETDYGSVVSATQSILENRTFKDEYGDQISFGMLHIRDSLNAEITSTIRMKTGEVYKVRERIWGSGNQTFIEQSTDNSNIGRFLVTVEAPFHVLKMRPLNPGESGFICRECAFDSREDKNICYFKMKHDHDVFVTAFWETKNP